MSNNPKIKYAKQRNGEIFYPRTVAEAIRFEDGESLETKAQNGGLGGGDVKNFPIATELEAREATSNEVLMTPLRTLQLLEENGGGVGGGGGGITIPIISSEFNKTSVDTGTEISIPFTFYSPNLGKGTLHCLVDGVEVVSKQIPQGSSYADFGVLPKGSHRLSIFVVDRGGVYTDTLSYNIRIGALDISSTFDDSTDFTITQVIKIPVTVDTISVDPIYLTYTIDNTSTRISAKIGYNVIQLPVLTPGAHKVTIKAESGVYVSNILAFNVVIEDATNLTLISDFDTKEITYRKLVEFIYRVSLKGAKQFVAQYYDNDELVKTLTIPAGTNIWSTRELPVGAHTLKIVVTTEDGSMSAELVRNIKIIESDYKPLESVSDASLIAYFDATGKTNNDFDKEVWADKSPSLEHPTVDFHNVNYGTNGWIDNALCLNGGAYAVINLQPLTEITNSGLTVDIRYRTRDVGFQDACVLDMRGSDSSRRGFAIDTEKIYMNSASTQLKSDVIQEEISRATFVIDPYNSIAKLYNNGVLTETLLMAKDESFYSDSKIYLGAKLEDVNGNWIPNIFGDCEIYSVRVYARALESEEIVQNHIADIVDLVEQQEKYELNYMNNMPTMYFYGDTSAMTKDFKVPLRIKYISTDPERYGDSFDLVDCQVSWQGTSSIQYAVKNYKIRLKNQDGSKFKYSPYPDGIKEDTFCLKADYMESSHANNTGMAKFINEQLYETPTPPQVNDPSVRSTINGFPIQLYIALNDSVEPTYIGIFNFNLDKSCSDSFGLDNEVEGFENCVRFEVSSNSDTSAGAFRDDSDESMRADFELNYPDADDLTSEQQDAYYVKLKRLITWVKNSTAETFKAELEQYFNKEYLIKYFVQAHLFGMVDNLGKNMMIATWDGNIWYPMFYDMDTQLGLDNTGYLEFASDVDMVEGVYNTSNSKLFTMLRECFASEIADTYCTLRRKGNYSMPTILSYWYGEQVSKIGELQYNKDMEAKYIAFKNDYLFMLHGRRYEHMKKWITERMLYLDTIYGFEADTSASITIRANTLNRINLNILTYSPQYLKVKWRNGIEETLRIGRDASGKMIPTTFSGTVATATDQEIIIYGAKQIKTIEGIASANPSVLNLVEASRLVSLDCKDCKLLSDVKLSSNNKFLSHINLSGCTLYGDVANGTSTTLDLSYLPYMTYVNLANTKVTSVYFPTTGCNLKELYLNGNDYLKTINLQNMPILTTLYISNKSVLSEFKVINCPNVTLSVNYKVNNYNYTNVTAESIVVNSSPNLFNNGSSKCGFNMVCTGQGATELGISIKELNIKDLVGIGTLNIAGCSSQNLSPTIKNLSIDIEVDLLQLFGIGFEVPVDELDINFSKVNRFVMKKFTNIKNINLTSNLKGVHVSNDSDMHASGNWIDFNTNNTNSKGIKAFTDFTTFETVSVDGVVAEDILDLSNLSMNLLWLPDDVLPPSITTVKINCDFTETYVYHDKAQEFFKLPIRCYVEGYLKSSNTCRTWCTTTTTSYPPMKNFDNLEWDLSAVTNLDSLLKNWRLLEKIPDSITPELISKAKYTNSMFSSCVALTDLNKLEGADLTFNFVDNVSGTSGMFGYIKGPFTLGNVTINTEYSYTGTAPMNVLTQMFMQSGLTSIGDFIVNNVNNCKINASELFSGCSKLESVGTISISGGSGLMRILKGCSSLKNLESITFDNLNTLNFIYFFENSSLDDNMLSKVNFLPEGAKLEGIFKGTKITDITKLNNYYNIIKTATNLQEAFRDCTQLTSVPDLEMSSNIQTLFYGCSSLVSVGSLTLNGSYSIREMFRRCTSLETIEKLDFKNATSGYYLFGDCTAMKRINYFDISKLSVGTATDIEANGLDIAIGGNTLVTCMYVGETGKYGYALKNSPNLDMDSVNSYFNNLVTYSTAWTLTVSKGIFDRLTSEIIALASSKNCTIANQGW